MRIVKSKRLKYTIIYKISGNLYIAKNGLCLFVLGPGNPVMGCLFVGILELEFGLTLVASNWPIHLPQGQASPHTCSSIDHGFSADTIEASAVLKPSSNSVLTIAWITESAMSPNLNCVP